MILKLNFKLFSLESDSDTCLDLLVLPWLRSGKLIQILHEETSPVWRLYLYRPQRGPTPLRIRALFDYLAEVLGRIET